MSEPIKLHDLAPAPRAKKKKARVDRGEAFKGKTAGRGTKGIKAHKQVSAAFKGGQTPLHMRLPKLKDFKNPAKVTFQAVNVSDLERLFPNGGDITIADLVAKGAIRANRPVKVLGDGDINVSVNATAAKFSGSTKSKIEATGGSVAEA